MKTTIQKMTDTQPISIPLNTTTPTTHISNQALLGMLGEQGSETRFSEALRAKFEFRPMSQAAPSQPTPLSPEVLQKGEEPHEKPIAGLKEDEDTELLDSNHNSNSQGDEIHIDGSLVPEKREEETMREVGHDVQLDSDTAQDSGLLEEKVSEQQKDPRGAAPMSLSMSTFSGEFKTDAPSFKAYASAFREELTELPNSDLINKDKYQFASMDNGCVGSVYFSLWDSIGSAARLRLLHRDGPQVAYHTNTHQFLYPYTKEDRKTQKPKAAFKNAQKNGKCIEIKKDFVEEAVKQCKSDNSLCLYEQYTNQNKDKRSHPSRGGIGKPEALNDLKHEDFQYLYRLVDFAQRIAEKDKDGGRWGEGTTNRNHANNFLLGMMAKNEALKKIPLNFSDFVLNHEFLGDIEESIIANYPEIQRLRQNS